MSEELLQAIPQRIGKYTYYRLGGTTLDQLKASGIIPKRNYGKLGSKKPDGLVIYQGKTKAVVEYKQPKELATQKQLQKAIDQEIDVARALCKMLVVTDGSKSFWVNALNGDLIKDAKGNDVRAVFHHVLVQKTQTIEHLLDEIDASISASNSTIRSARLIDPTPLAKRLWQTIWVATGKSPVKCLYNVVELFIFKFLSDLQVLSDDIAFNRVREKALSNPEDALEYYARNSRVRIYKLFPEGADGTTIINGTIFINENGDPNLSQSILFQRCLEHLRRYTEEFGSLTKIDKQFKTKLYESFLKQEVEALGQYFTPRKIIQTMIRLAGLDEPSFQYGGKRFCDPFCGVGGFPLEMLNMNNGMRAAYTPDASGIIHLPFVVHGFDKGFETDDERTIILAKANMVIYLAELLFSNPQCSGEFARVFNETFVLFRDNLGTFGHIITNEAEKYDFILSNPPYVTSGTSIIKEEIRKTPRTVGEYPVNALGLEGLSLEWVVKSLKRGGKAFLIIPDGLLGRSGGKRLRDYILRECFLDAVISLPVRTFYSNFKHTYILALTKKNDPGDVQSEPVFTYLVSNIGERLTSVKREEIDGDNLPELEGLFKIFSGARGTCKALLENQSLRCKVQDVSLFEKCHHWVIDRWWSRDELIALGEADSLDSAEKNQVDAVLGELNAAIQDYGEFLEKICPSEEKSRRVALGDSSLFRLCIGKRVLKKDWALSAGEIPLYSANVHDPVGFVQESNIADFGHPSILWGIDGNFEFNLVPAGQPFATTDHCGAIQILDVAIVPEYLLHALMVRRVEESFHRSFRASLGNMSRFIVAMPIKPDGTFDAAAQRRIASRFVEATDKKEQLIAAKERFDDLFGRYVCSPVL